VCVHRSRLVKLICDDKIHYALRRGRSLDPFLTGRAERKVSYSYFAVFRVAKLSAHIKQNADTSKTFLMFCTFEENNKLL
jgi:hypothetical protein